MASRALLLLRGPSSSSPTLEVVYNNKRTGSSTSQLLYFRRKLSSTKATATTDGPSSLSPPDVPRLAETARISLTPHKRFGQLQAVDLDSVEPAIRADTEGDNLRDDSPKTFEKREDLIASVPSYEEPCIKVPKVLNKEEHWLALEEKRVRLLTVVTELGNDASQ